MATIVIKVNDRYFLQRITYSKTINLGKINIGKPKDFFSVSNMDTIYGTNLLPGLFPSIDVQNSKIIFQRILDKVGAYPLINLFSAKYPSNLLIESKFAVSLMRQAFPTTPLVQSAYENLLNYYYLDIADTSAIIVLIDTLKNLPGVDKVYVRGELSSIKAPIINPPNTFDAILWEGIEFKDKFVPVENLPEPRPSSEKKSEILPEANTEIASNLPEAKAGNFEEIKLDKNLIQNISVLPLPPPPPPTIPPIIPINDKITSLFSYCGLNSTDKVKKLITVMDFEFGWKSVNNDSAYSSLASTSPPNKIFGGGTNDNDLQFANHGQKTLNILFGQRNPRSNQIDGLCKGATAKLASPSFPTINGKQPEPALVKTLVDSGMVKGDILLLEVQKDRWNRLDLPVEIESALHAVIRLGVKAGYIIIECAANGGHNLNNNITNVSRVPLSTLPAGIQTVENPPVDISTNGNGTGSIMVGGRDNQFNIDRSLNYGNRVDYYCFGETSLVSSSPLLPTTENTFSATSLAGAITTALVAHFQSEAMNLVADGGIGRRLTISEIKLLLGSIPYSVDTPPSPPPIYRTPIRTPNETIFQNFLTTRGITTMPILP